MNKRNAIRFAALVVILLLLAVLLYFRFRPEEEPVQNLSPICIQGLYPGGDRLWLVRGSPDHIPGEYELYALAEDGTETYIAPFPASQVIWNREREVFHYLAQTRLRTFDPATEQEQTQPIQHEYLHLCTAEGETVFAQRELYGTVAALSLSDASERELSVAGRVVAVEDGRLLVWDDASQQLICHDYAADAVIWRVDLPDHPLVCAIGGDLYLGQQSGGPLYRIPRFYPKRSAAGDRRQRPAPGHGGRRRVSRLRPAPELPGRGTLGAVPGRQPGRGGHLAGPALRG